jgi:mycothiol synthase
VPVRRATVDDLDEIVQLLTARDRAVFGEVSAQRHFLEHDFANVANDCLVATDNGRLTGYAALNGARDIGLAAVDADSADSLLAEVERRARDRGFDRVTCIAVPEDTVLWPLLERSGYRREREIVRMWRALDGDLAAPTWPSDAGVRTFEDADAHRVRTLLDSSYAGWDPDYSLREHDDWLAFMTGHDDFDPAMWFLCERGDDLVGCALHWRASEGKGWVKDIVVRKSERGRGLGRALLEHGFREYRDRGVERVGLKVDANNPTGALQLYERVGFVPDRRYRIWEHVL